MKTTWNIFTENRKRACADCLPLCSEVIFSLWCAMNTTHYRHNNIIYALKSALRFQRETPLYWRPLGSGYTEAIQLFIKRLSGAEVWGWRMQKQMLDQRTMNVRSAPRVRSDRISAFHTHFKQKDYWFTLTRMYMSLFFCSYLFNISLLVYNSLLLHHKRPALFWHFSQISTAIKDVLCSNGRVNYTYCPYWMIRL